MLINVYKYECIDIMFLVCYDFWFFIELSNLYFMIEYILIYVKNIKVFNNDF